MWDSYKATLNWFWEKNPTVLQSAATPANKLLTKNYELQIAVHSGVNYMYTALK